MAVIGVGRMLKDDRVKGQDQITSIFDISDDIADKLG